MNDFDTPDTLEASRWEIAVREAEHLCPTELPHLDKIRWKAKFLRSALAEAQPEETTTRHGTEGAYEVSPDTYWRYDRPPRGVKVFLLNEGGVAVAPGPWVDGQGLIGWLPLPRRNKDIEKEQGLS